MNFEFRTPDGSIVRVHTVVGNGRLANVVVEEHAPEREPVAIEPEEA